MFDIAVVRFLTPEGQRAPGAPSLAAGKSYEYRIPDFLKDKVVPKMLAIVSVKGSNGDKINSGVAEIQAVKNVLDGDYMGEFAFIVGVVDPEPFADIERAERRRTKLLGLIKQEKERLMGELDLSSLSSLSPTMAALVAELQNVNSGVPVTKPIGIAPDWVHGEKAPETDRS